MIKANVGLYHKTENMENERKLRKKSDGNIFAGVILVLVGGALLLRNTGFPLPYWLFSWPMILIAVGIYSGFKSNFTDNGWLIMIAVGGFFLADKIFTNLSLAPYFWPVLIIAIGLIFILRPKTHTWTDQGFYDRKTTDPKDTAPVWGRTGSEEKPSFDSNDFVDVKSVFSGIQKNILSKNFQGGKITSVFGGSDIDLTQAELQGRATLRFEVVFGGVKIIVPPHWTVYNELEGVFHGVDDKRKYNQTGTIDTEKVLILKGSVVFGGVEIRSY